MGEFRFRRLTLPKPSGKKADQLPDDGRAITAADNTHGVRGGTAMMRVSAARLLLALVRAPNITRLRLPPHV